MKAARLLEEKGIHAMVVNASSVSPLDEKLLRELAEKSIPVFTVEEHSLKGGLGCAVAEYCAAHRLPAPKKMLGLQEGFVPHGSRRVLLGRLGLNAEGIARSVEEK